VIINETAQQRFRKTPKYRDWHAKYYKENKDKYKNSHYKRRYGITFTEVTQLWKDTAGLCNCCGTFLKAPGESRCTHVDHCHETGKIRGILCNSCNTALGRLGDNLNGVMGLVRYLS